MNDMLFIDDEEGVRRSVVRALKREPYRIRTADNGEAGIDGFLTEPFDNLHLRASLRDIAVRKRLRQFVAEQVYAETENTAGAIEPRFHKATVLFPDIRGFTRMSQDVAPDGSAREHKRNWARLIQKSYETDPLCCPACSGEMKIISIIERPDVIKKILRHLGLWDRKVKRRPKMSTRKSALTLPLLSCLPVKTIFTVIRNIR